VISTESLRPASRVAELITDLLITDYYWVPAFLALVRVPHLAQLEARARRNQALQLCLIGVAQHAGENELARLVVDYRK
jgi:hypothetical protein